MHVMGVYYVFVYDEQLIFGWLSAVSSITSVISSQHAVAHGSHHMYHQIDVISLPEWNIKEDTGKSMKNALYVL